MACITSAINTGVHTQTWTPTYLICTATDHYP